VFSARTSGELVCLEAGTGKEIWQTNTVSSLKNGSSIHLTPNGDSVLLFTDQGNLIRARLSSEGYQELSRVHLLDATHPFNGRNVVWPPPAYANHRVFARNDKEILCASLEQEP
jgi:outer membrane protein assembly factor BamB